MLRPNLLSYYRRAPRFVKACWLIAVSLGLSRALDGLHNALFYYSLHLPFTHTGFHFIAWLNACILLSLSFAIVSTAGWALEG
jgi:hypothetical protein